MNLTVIDSLIKNAAASPNEKILIVSAVHGQRRNTFSQFLSRLEIVQNSNPFDDAIEAVIPPILIRFESGSWIKFDTRGQGLPLGTGVELTGFVEDERVVLTSEEHEQLASRMFR